jgi:hypothetical protein
MMFPILIEVSVTPISDPLVLFCVAAGFAAASIPIVASTTMGRSTLIISAKEIFSGEYFYARRRLQPLNTLPKVPPEKLGVEDTAGP